MTGVVPRWESVLLRTMHLVGGLAIALMVLQVTANGILRKLGNVQIPHTLELTQWWYVPVIVCAGIVIAEIEREHFEVDAVFGMLPRGGRRVLSVFAHIVTLGLVTLLALFTAVEALDAIEIGREEPVTGIPIWPVYILVSFAFAAYAVLLLVKLYRVVVSNRGEELDPVEPEEQIPA